MFQGNWLIQKLEEKGADVRKGSWKKVESSSVTLCGARKRKKSPRGEGGNEKSKDDD